MSHTATFEESTAKAGYWEMRTPYDTAFLDEFKRAVPPQMREWDGDEKVWRVHESELDKASAIASNYWHVEVE